MPLIEPSSKKKEIEKEFSDGGLQSMQWIDGESSGSLLIW